MDGMELKLKRVKARIRQWDLAKEAGVNPGRISEMESGIRPVSEAVADAIERLTAATV